MTTATKRNDSKMNQMIARSNHQTWLGDNPKGTLGQLLVWLEKAHEECLSMTDDEELLIEEAEDVPETLAEYLSAFDDHDGETFAFREADIDEDIQRIEALIDELGESMRLSKLPKLEFNKKV